MPSHERGLPVSIDLKNVFIEIPLFCCARFRQTYRWFPFPSTLASEDSLGFQMFFFDSACAFLLFLRDALVVCCLLRLCLVPAAVAKAAAAVAMRYARYTGYAAASARA